jgi:8-oxo-dGTP pyrophosphatase MutT (NUDIX family)
MNPAEKHHKVQVVLFCEETQSILMLLTTPQRGSIWQNVTGSVEAGETFAQAALRELHEETGLVLDPEQLEDLSWSFSFIDSKGRDVEEHCFLALAPKKFNAVVDKKEHLRLWWKKIKYINDKDFGFPSNYEAFTWAKIRWGK